MAGEDSRRPLESSDDCEVAARATRSAWPWSACGGAENMAEMTRGAAKLPLKRRRMDATNSEARRTVLWLGEAGAATGDTDRRDARQ